MVEDIENKSSDTQRLAIIKENLEFFGDLMHEDSVLAINLGDCGDRAKFSVNYITCGLKEALETPAIRSINISNSSVILYDDGGMKGLFLANRVPEKQCRMGLPGFLPDNTRSYYGVVWGKTVEPRIYYSYGNELFGRENRAMEGKDASAVHALYFAVSDFAMQITKDPISREKKHELLGIRKREISNY